MDYNYFTLVIGNKNTDSFSINVEKIAEKLDNNTSKCPGCKS